MSPAARLAADVCLFILEEQGVFFSEARQELYIFNTPATFIWCCLEEGLGAEEIATSYVETFGVEPSSAQRQVADLLQRWYGLGYLSGVEAPGASEIALTTALGRLLTNPSLRRELTAAPEDTARKLLVRAADLDVFLAIDPGALEAQAERLAERQPTARRGGPASGPEDLLASVLPGDQSLLDLALQARARGGAPLRLARHYRLLTTTFRLQFASAEIAATVHAALAHLEIAEPARVDATLDVLAGDAEYVLLEGIIPVGYCARLEHLAPLVKSAVRRIAINRHSYFLQLHAGVVSIGERCVILPAAPGRGKTTLTAALLLAGFQYFSDEYALLEKPAMRLRPVPLALTIKPGSAAVLAARYPEIQRLPTHIREDEQVVRYLCPPSPLPGPETEQPVGFIVFPDYAPDAQTVLRPLGRAEALDRLMRECLVLPEALDRSGVESLVRWMREVECFDLTMSSLDGAVHLIRDMCNGGR